jgi:hypothetical protein
VISDDGHNHNHNHNANPLQSAHLKNQPCSIHLKPYPCLNSYTVPIRRATHHSRTPSPVRDPPDALIYGVVVLIVIKTTAAHHSIPCSTPLTPWFRSVSSPERNAIPSTTSLSLLTRQSLRSPGQIFLKKCEFCSCPLTVYRPIGRLVKGQIALGGSTPKVDSFASGGPSPETYHSPYWKRLPLPMLLRQ